MHRADRLFWVVIGGVLLGALGGVHLVSRAGSPPPSRQVKRQTPSREPATPKPSSFSAAARHRRRAIFAQVQGAGAFRRLGQPEPGDWLWSFRESGQTLQEYARSVVNRKVKGRETLHLLPFSDLDALQRGLLPRIREHTARFFDTHVKVLPAAPVKRSWYQRDRDQYNADIIVRHLARKVPADSLGLFGLMGSDLYGLGLSFVFGEALLHDRAGIYSVRRYGRQNPMLLRRALKLSAHEIGHMFGLKHCVFYECVMNGVNSLTEMDRSPLHLCPVCLAKLRWNLKFDPARRYRRLGAFYRGVGLEDEARFVLARVKEVAMTGPQAGGDSREAR